VQSYAKHLDIQKLLRKFGFADGKRKLIAIYFAFCYQPREETVGGHFWKDVSKKLGVRV